MQYTFIAILVVVIAILTVHFDICILPKYIFDGNWGKWGRGSFMKGDVPDFDSKFGG